MPCAPFLKRGIPFTYILRLQSGGLYVGCSMDFETRFAEHAAGTACRTTRLDVAISVAWIELHPNVLSARHREAQIKKWSRAKKEALIAGNFENLKALSRSKD